MSRAVLDGEVVEVVDLKVIGPESKTVEFPLSDGSRFVWRVTVNRAARAVKKFNSIGEPVYNVDISQNAQVRDIPTEFCITPEAAKTKNLKRGPEVA